MNTAGVVLLENGSATSDPVQWPGGKGVVTIVGTFGATSATLEYLGPDNTTYLTVKTLDPSSGAQTDVALTANGSIGFMLPPGPIRVALTGGTPSGMYASANRVPE